MLKPLTKWLACEAGLEIGQTLFAGMRPANAPALSTTLREIGPEVVDPYNKRKREKSVQIETRGSSYFSARDEAHRIFDLVVNRFGLTTVEGWTDLCTSGTAPQYLPVEDASGPHVFVANVVVRAKKEG